MSEKYFKVLLALITLLSISIFLMGVALVISEKTFGIISSYIAIACVIVTLVGVAVIMVLNRKNNNNDDKNK